MAIQQPQQGVSRQKVVWLHDKGRNTIARDEMIGDLLNIVAAWRDPKAPKIMTQKDFASTTMSVKDKLALLTPSMQPKECPLARILGIPLTVYACPEAKAGEAPSKGELNFVAMLLTRNLDGSQRSIRGKALVCIDTELTQNKGPLDLELDILVKILFFTADLLKDTIGHIKDNELLTKKLNYSRLFFNFYGPGRHVVKQMTELHVQDPSKGPNSPVQILTIPMLEMQLKAVQERNMKQMQQQQQMQKMPPFMHEEYMNDKAFRAEIQQIVLRGWKPPSSSSVEEGDDDNGSSSQNKSSGDNDELDFSDLN